MKRKEQLSTRIVECAIKCRDIERESRLIGLCTSVVRHRGACDNLWLSIKKQRIVTTRKITTTTTTTPDNNNKKKKNSKTWYYINAAIRLSQHSVGFKWFLKLSETPRPMTSLVSDWNQTGLFISCSKQLQMTREKGQSSKSGCVLVHLRWLNSGKARNRLESW